jgi:hypothetical protein
MRIIPWPFCGFPAVQVVIPHDFASRQLMQPHGPVSAQAKRLTWRHTLDGTLIWAPWQIPQIQVRLQSLGFTCREP